MADTIEQGIGNTFKAVTADGATVWHFNADKTYTQINPDGSQVTGSWRTANNEVFFSPKGGGDWSSPYEPGKKVGDTWDASVAGVSAKVSLVAGR